MIDTPKQHLLAVVRKFGQYVIREIISAREFINHIFDEFAHMEGVYPELIPELWAAVPETIRGEFAASVRDAIRPDFRYQAFYIGGGRPMSEDELLRDADLRTARVQAWAREFVKFLETAEKTRLAEVPEYFIWPVPWRPLPLPSGYLGQVQSVEAELQWEVCPGHPLYRIACRVVAWNAGDINEFLLATAHPAMPLAFVHLTFQSENDPGWPFTIGYSGWDVFREAWEGVGHHDG